MTDDLIYHVRLLQILGLCKLPEAESDRWVGDTHLIWLLVAVRDRVTCPQCRLLVDVIRANKLEVYWRFPDTLSSAVREVLRG